MDRRCPGGGWGPLVLAGGRRGMVALTCTLSGPGGWPLWRALGGALWWTLWRALGWALWWCPLWWPLWRARAGAGAALARGRRVLSWARVAGRGAVGGGAGRGRVAALEHG